MENKIDLVSIFLSITTQMNNNKLAEEKLFMQMNKSLCNDVLYNDPKYKESAIILTHIINDLMRDFVKEVNNCVNKVGAYKNE